MKYLIYIFILTVVFFLNTVKCLASSPIAIYNCNLNIKAYQDQHLGTYADDLSAFIQVLESANLSYDTITYLTNPDNTPNYTNYKVIILPLLVDISSEDVVTLQNYLNNGGHILVFNNGGTLSKTATGILNILNLQIVNQCTPNKSFELSLDQANDNNAFNFSVGSNFNLVNINGNTTKILGSFNVLDQNNQLTKDPAIVISNKSAFMAWCLGLQGDITNNSKLLSLTLQNISPGFIV